MKMKFTLSILVIFVLSIGSFANPKNLQKSEKPKKEKGFKTLWDGKSFKDWKISEPEKNSWSIVDGAIVAKGPRSHLFYVGDPKPFVNFEYKLDVMTEPKSNGGIYFHTVWQETGFPKMGFEVQVNQSHGDWKKTGSLYNVVNVKENLAKDNEWYSYHIIVKGKHVTVKVNDQVAVDWEQPADRQPGKDMPAHARQRYFRLSSTRSRQRRSL